MKKCAQCYDKNSELTIEECNHSFCRQCLINKNRCPCCYVSFETTVPCNDESRSGPYAQNDVHDDSSLDMSDDEQHLSPPAEKQERTLTKLGPYNVYGLVPDEKRRKEIEERQRLSDKNMKELEALREHKRRNPLYTTPLSGATLGSSSSGGREAFLSRMETNMSRNKNIVDAMHHEKRMKEKKEKEQAEIDKKLNKLREEAEKIKKNNHEKRLRREERQKEEMRMRRLAAFSTPGSSLNGKVGGEEESTTIIDQGSWLREQQRKINDHKFDGIRRAREIEERKKAKRDAELAAIDAKNQKARERFCASMRD